jgi:hypothetical protein
MQYANHIGYSDINPYEVIRKISDKTLEIRSMNAERDPSWKPDIVPGGFCANYRNQDQQKWIITRSEDSQTVLIRLGKRGWKDRDGRRFSLSDKPCKFYDYNF